MLGERGLLLWHAISSASGATDRTVLRAAATMGLTPAGTAASGSDRGDVPARDLIPPRLAGPARRTRRSLSTLQLLDEGRRRRWPSTGSLDFDPANGPVLGWIMNQARSRAIDRVRFEHRKKRLPGDIDSSPDRSPEIDPQQVLAAREQEDLVRDALGVLTSAERQAIETTFLATSPIGRPPTGSSNRSGPSKHASAPDWRSSGER
jgi:hypothetical protein